MRQVRLLLVLLLGGVFILVATPGTAVACSCGQMGLAEYADEISVAFVGRQVDRVEHNQSDPDGVTLTFEVDRVFKGEVATSIELTTSASSASCGTDLASRGTTGVAAFESRTIPSVSLCGSGVTEAALIDAFGLGYAPLVLPVGSQSDDGLGALLPLLVLAGGLTSLVGAGLIVSRRLRS